MDVRIFKDPKERKLIAWALSDKSPSKFGDMVKDVFAGGFKKLEESRALDIKARWTIRQLDRGQAGFPREPFTLKDIESPQLKYKSSAPENQALKRIESKRKQEYVHRAVKNAAALRHTAETEKIHERWAQDQRDTTPDSPIAKHRPKKTPKEHAKQSHMSGNKNVVKGKTVTNPTRNHRIKNMWDRLNNRKWSRFAVGIGIALAISYVNSRVANGAAPVQLAASNPVSFDPRSSAYIPERVSRGYDTLKESFTPFGSPIQLSKTKMTITPMRTSTRKGMIRTTTGIINRSIPFHLHSKAIGHTRY